MSSRVLVKPLQTLHNTDGSHTEPNQVTFESDAVKFVVRLTGNNSLGSHFTIVRKHKLLW